MELHTLLLSAFMLASWPAAAMAIDVQAGIAVTLSDGKTVTLSGQALAALPNETVKATAHGKTSTFSGYDLRAVLTAAGVKPLESLRGKQLRRVVTATAADGYEVVFALAELDPSLGNRKVLLADRENGAPLSAKDGPWRLVVPADGRPARWERQVLALKITDIP
jgi:hypothetical protein